MQRRAMPTNKKVLITGASGLVGSVLRNGLNDSYNLSGVDIVPIDGFDCLVADTTDLSAIQPAFEGADTVIDLASIPSQHSPWDVVHRNNLPSTYNALEAARVAGARRVIFASSNHATGNYENDHPYSAIVAGQYDDLDPDAIPLVTTSMPIRPDGPYGIGKAFGEAAGRYYSDLFGLSVLCMRIGTLNRQSRPMEPRQFATLLTHGDLVRLVESCIDAPDDLRFGIYYGVSDNKWRFWDISNSRDEIGCRPQDNAETWR
ncbi:MAG: NAD(P)-dependent oxidoreductase [SAR202 cluster bacterium]|nr:epimerase [Chloroflexota bacterium]MQG57462.1 NAD(P)-dependent oxidoreductase [SAR202 cluster bacterium]MQG70359.1 NAD(P)-dependent oxidoreductase [SAR202 cluster bacterium]HAL49104.1 NAD(P)-dependent oxidoreductase [Dehalococcoidia bacterium]|tara:strand:+ start:917 stop:1696 length:780 start_codon:yes stop_codon:yes gene_type:complete